MKLWMTSVITCVAMVGVTGCSTGQAEREVAPMSAPASSIQTAPLANAENGSAQDNKALIIYHTGNAGAILSVAKNTNSEVVYDLQNLNIVVVRLPVGADREKLKKAFLSDDGVVGVEDDQVSYTLETPSSGALRQPPRNELSWER